MAHGFLESQPACGPLYTVLYQYYLRANRLSDAEAILKSKVAHNPKVSLYRIELAGHYARVSGAREMSEALNEVLSHPQDFPNAHLDVGDFYVESRNWVEARRQYELGLQSDPHSQVTYWKRLVRVHLATNDRPAAQQLLEQILKAQPNDGDAKASRAAMRMAGNDPEQKKLAAAEFKTLVNEFPESADYRFQYAEALRFNGDVDGAQAQYLAVLQRQPKNLAAIQELADIHIRKQRLDEALDFADRALAIDRSSVRAQLVRSAALASKRRFAETRSILTDLLKQHPELHEAHLQLALLDVEEKHYPEAEKRFRQYYKPGQGDVRALEGLVELYRAQNQIAKAVALLQQDLEKNPQSNEVRVLLANVAAQAGQNDLALAQYEQLARAEADSPALALRLGLAYQAKHDSARAVAEFERARKLAPQDALVYAYLGKALEDSERKPEAIAIYRQSMSLDSHNPWVKNNLAYLMADTGGDLNQALRLAQEAERQQPNEASFTDTVGWVYLKKGDFASAMHVFEAVLEKSPRNVTFRIHLAMTLLASGNPARGRLELISARQFPCTPEEKSQIAELFNRFGSTQ
jgi:tetratricopeptide (TPR) repeat protein